MPAYFWSCAALTDRGAVRERNEDSYYLDGVCPPGEGKLCSAGPMGGGVVAVFDGLGGEQAGDYASQTAAKLLDGYRSALRSCRDGERVKALAERYLSEANAAMRARGAALGGSCGSTLALLVFRSGTAHLLNLGDSRIYLLRGGRLTQLSRDHTAAAYLAAQGVLSPEEARSDPRRNALTRHMGAEGGSALRPYFLPQIRVAPGDRFLLCSDGVSSMLEEAELTRVLRAARSASACAETLIRLALKSGGRDNATALCAFVSFRLF